ncbi:MAG: hypothetical protein COB12_01230 [Flavobacterium sp.]|nr:MAG: hypothetical protein COB12_01230 [Flavobacterium sp.]
MLNTNKRILIGIPIIIICVWMGYNSYRIDSCFATLFFAITPLWYFYTVWKNRNKVETKAGIKNRSIYLFIIVALGFIVFLISK